jgi:hypothetical protein
MHNLEQLLHLEFPETVEIIRRDRESLKIKTHFEKKCGKYTGSVLSDLAKYSQHRKQ